MIQVKSFINQLMSSNCYVVFDDKTLRCFVIDPGSQYSEKEIEFIDSKKLKLDYIILTHEHSDHTWGCNALLEKYNPKLICSELCKYNLSSAGDAYFQYYYEETDYTYSVKRIDYTIESLNNSLAWSDHIIKFINTPGHSMGSVCIELDNALFTGDTLMRYKPYVNKRNGSMELYKKSISMLMTTYSGETMIYPGHGEPFKLKNIKVA